jgi:NADH dehydrogenase
MILVVGATGSLGGRVARGLLERGAAVRAMARATSDVTALEEAGAAVIRGNLKEPDSLARACRGVETVITTASMSRRGDDSIENVDLEGNRQLIEAAAAAGVRHLIFTSTLGASEASPLPLFRAKAAAEARLKASGMDWTILQPNAFMDVWFGMLIEMPLFSGQPVTLVGESRRRHSFVAEQDVARFAIAATDHPAARNATIAIGGPAAITLLDAVRAYEGAAGRPVEIRRVAPGEPIPGLPDMVAGLAANLETYDSPIPMDDTARTYGVPLTSVGAFARERLAAAAAGRPATGAG